MKTILEIKKNFSNEEIKLLVEIVKGKQEFDVMGEQKKTFMLMNIVRVTYQIKMMTMTG